MGLKCGIVGLPNVGKSTLFNALTKAGIAASNYPFCTIEPNVGIVSIPDPRLEQLAAIVKPQRILPTTIEFVDIAGLVKGAAQGEGLGNQFLANIRETDAIIHIVRCFKDPDVSHVHGSVNPLDDIEVINTELALADLATVEKALNKCQKLAKSGDKVKIQEKAILEKIKQHLDQGKLANSLVFDDDEAQFTGSLFLLTYKPVLYVANVNEDGFDDNPYLTQVQQYAAQDHSGVVAICASIEAELIELDEAEKIEFMQALGIEEPGLNRVIRASYDLLKLHTYFTAGVKEVRAWTIPQDCSAPQAAGVIHTDFEKGFIRAEVIAFDDYISGGGEQKAKEAGKLRQEGKAYKIHDGDVIHFLFNV